MKTELKVTGLCLAGSLLVGMTLTWALQALNRERLLQQQVDELVAHANQLAAEKPAALDGDCGATDERRRAAPTRTVQRNAPASGRGRALASSGKGC